MPGKHKQQRHQATRECKLKTFLKKKKIYIYIYIEFMAAGRERRTLPKCFVIPFSILRYFKRVGGTYLKDPSTFGCH